MPAHDFLKMSEQELLTRADQCLERAGSALDAPPPRGIDHFTRLHLFLEAQSCVAEVLRRQAEQTAARDRKRNEEIAQRDLQIAKSTLKMEKAVIWLISVEIVLSLGFGGYGIYEGIKQSHVLDQQLAVLGHLDEKLVGAQDASLKILQEQQAEHAKKPRLALYADNILVDRASVHPKPAPGSAQTQAPVDLSIKNEGDAPVNTFRIHAVVPIEVVVFSEQQLIAVPEAEPPANPKTRRVTLELPLLPAGQTARIHTRIYVPNGHSPFKIPFTVDALELQAVAPLGSLTILPPKP
jgi:hypothetical protein